MACKFDYDIGKYVCDICGAETNSPNICSCIYNEADEWYDRNVKYKGDDNYEEE